MNPIRNASLIAVVCLMIQLFAVVCLIQLFAVICLIQLIAVVCQLITVGSFAVQVCLIQLIAVVCQVILVEFWKEWNAILKKKQKNNKQFSSSNCLNFHSKFPKLIYYSILLCIILYELDISVFNMAIIINNNIN